MNTGNNTNLNATGNDNNSSKDEKTNDEQRSIPNPFEPGSRDQITQEDIENEQKFKEALTERD